MKYLRDIVLFLTFLCSLLGNKLTLRDSLKGPLFNNNYVQYVE